jgi:hypothetical protein
VWAKSYARRHNTSLTQMVVGHWTDLRELEKGIDVPQI